MSVGIIGIISMPVGLNKKFEIKELIGGPCHIVSTGRSNVMRNSMQCAHYKHA
jgi:hypothetical protein